MVKKYSGKRFKVSTVDEMLVKLNVGLNLNKQVLVVSDEIGFTIVFMDGILNDIEYN
jgi:hypothetical protein